MVSKPTHGGKRTGAGRKPALLPLFLKALRATEEERKEFFSMLTGDARQDFLRILKGLRHIETLSAYNKPSVLDQAMSKMQQGEYPKKDKQS
jgi:hypothetical protein